MKTAALALLWNEKREVLAVSRKTNHEDLGFPGGKVEPGETVEKALVRELREETGCDALEYEKVFETEDGGGYWAVTFHVYTWTGTPTAREGAAVLWVPPRRLLEPSCSWAAYNRALFDSLRVLPPA